MLSRNREGRGQVLQLPDFGERMNRWPLGLFVLISFLKMALAKS